MSNKFRLVQFVSSTALVMGLAGCQSVAWPWAKSAANPANSASSTQPLVKSEPAKPLTADQKADMQLTIASSLEHEGRSDEAQQIYESLIKKNPKSPEAYHCLALLHDKAGDGKKAEEYYRAALERDPKNADLLCDLGYSYYVQRRWAESERRLREALAINPKLGRANNNLGLVLAHTERHELALASFKQAGCQDADAHVNLAYCLLLDQQRDLAEQHLQLALRADPNSQAAGDLLVRLRGGSVKDAAAPPSHVSRLPAVDLASPLAAMPASDSDFPPFETPVDRASWASEMSATGTDPRDPSTITFREVP